MAENSLATLEFEKAQLVNEYLETFKTSTDTQELSGMLSRLDGFYWKYVEALICSRIEPGMESLSFTPEQRLILDMGLLDESIVNGAPENFRDELLAELSQSGHVNHFYLSEWLEDRFRKFRVNESITPEQTDNASESRYEVSRKNILNRLAPLLEGLPGVPQEISKTIVSGQLDVQILQMGANMLGNSLRKDMMVRHRLWDLRRQVFNKAKERTKDSKLLKFFDVLQNLYQMEWREMYEETRRNPTMTAEERRENILEKKKEQQTQEFRKKVTDFLLGELHFARNLMPLGSLAGGVMRPCAVLTNTEKRVTKKDTARMIERAGECVRSFSIQPVVLIAPFKGRGIYEWDRDSLVISLRPSQTPDDSLANAIANYTMMIDSLQKSGELKKSYAEIFPGTSFQKEFQSDFRDWLCCAGVGKDDCMNEGKLEFFRKNIGLDLHENPAESLAPVEMRHLSAQARTMVRSQLQRQVSSAKDSWGARWRLGLLLWMEGQTEEALKEITHAAKLQPDSVPLLMGVCLLLLQSGRLKQAEQILQICSRNGASTIWKLYAERELNLLKNSASLS